MTATNYADSIHVSTADEIDSLPAGDYILGDPCYSLSDPVWLRVVEALDDLREGMFFVELPDGRSFTAVFFSPQDGDGMYEIAGRDESLLVDSGLLALLPTTLIDEVGKSEENYVGSTVEVIASSPISFTEDDGIFIIQADEDYPVNLGNS